jgi:gluconokinase
MCLEHEATSRGAALLALERLGAIGNIAELPPNLGQPVQPDPAKMDLYLAALAKQRRLYWHLFEED